MNKKVISKSVVKYAYTTRMVYFIVEEDFVLGGSLVLFVGAKFIYFEMGFHRDYCVYYWENFGTCSTEVSRAQTILIAEA